MVLLRLSHGSVYLHPMIFRQLPDRHFSDGLFPNRQFPQVISSTNSSPTDSSPKGQFPERTFPQTDISLIWHFPQHVFHFGRESDWYELKAAKAVFILFQDKYLKAKGRKSHLLTRSDNALHINGGGGDQLSSHKYEELLGIPIYHKWGSEDHLLNIDF